MSIYSHCQEVNKIVAIRSHNSFDQVLRVERFSVKESLDSFRVVDPDRLIAQVENSFTDAAQKLNPAICQRILETVSDGATLSTRNGIPGFHAEVQAVNRLLNRFPELNINDISTSTLG